MCRPRSALCAITALAAGFSLHLAAANAEPLSLLPTAYRASTPFDGAVRNLPETFVREEHGEASVPAHLRRQVVSYSGPEAAGTLIVDTPNTYLYYVLGGGKAIRYGIGVGREGFTWSGTQSIARKAEWPDWIPPADMIARQPYLPRFMAGGPSNPLGARAMYLGNSIYRIHGTNDPTSIGKRVSSGCIRMLNEDAIDLYQRAALGAKVVVLPDQRRRSPEPHIARRPAVPPGPSATLQRSGIY